MSRPHHDDQATQTATIDPELPTNKEPLDQTLHMHKLSNTDCDDNKDIKATLKLHVPSSSLHKDKGVVMALHAGSVALLENNVGVSDMCLLEPVTEDSFIRNLHARFLHDQIYTYIGNVVVSVNPYKVLPLYRHDVIFEYRSRNIYELPPHIYAVSDLAYRSMRDVNQDQCVIISGESGSGKTEASKAIMQYVAAVSGKGHEIDRVKEQLLQSNPVLEAFGNAKTHRNDNSSRFGKYMDIEFDFKGDPIGGVITNYLLEKSRVAVQSKGERSFHIFYQLLAGADTTFLKSLKLQRNPEQYSFLKLGGASAHVESQYDKETFLKTKTAMSVIGFSRDEIVAVFRLVASVLKLGNIHFQHQSNMDGTDGCKLINEDEVYEVCELLECDVGTLINALTQRTVETSGERVKTDLGSIEATYARDALCKAMYTRMFTWLVHKINDSIRVRTRGRKKCMGVLDIYGFEIFEHNSFEQFIINYCNEKLQQIFIELTLKEEQDEYVNEGIEWIHVDYFNNAVICDLIEKNNVGILAMLDEECLRPGTVSDETFLNKLTQMCCGHPHYESRGCKKNRSDKTLSHGAFRLIHYAGMVTYEVEGFIEKNNDLLYRDLSRAMYLCQHPLLKVIFPEGNPERASLRRPPTAGSQFKSSVNELMKNLQTKCPNYIRCIKPNDFQRAGVFDHQRVMHQVRYLGLLENLRVRRAGYAFRQSYEQFLYRFKMLSPMTWPAWRGMPSDGVAEIFDHQMVDEQEYAYGRSKIFIRNPRTLFGLENLRRDRMHDLATLLQKVYRGWRARQHYQQLRTAQIIISCFYRGFAARKRFLELRHAAIVINSYVRGWKARRILAEMRYHQLCLWAVSVIRKYFYGWKVRKEYRRKFRAIAGPKIVRFIYNCLRRRFLENLVMQLPSPSPIDGTWPSCSPLFYAANEHLCILHHQWRCEMYRQECDQQFRNKMREKVIASDLFRERKTAYPRSVSHPFKGDYVRLRHNTKWQRIAHETNDLHLVFADIVMKVNRKNGKMVPQLLVMSTNALLVLDQRTMVIKYRIPVTEFVGMSLSPYNDKICIFHLQKHENGDLLTKKGDFLLSSDHIIEIASKMFLLIQNATNLHPAVHIATHMDTEMNGVGVEVSFKTGVPEVPPGSVKILRKANKIEILQA